MNRAVILAALLLCPLALAAQSPDIAQTLTVLNPGDTVASSCPIAMDARQGVWAHTAPVENGRPHDGIGQRISLTLADLHSATIVHAAVKILGLSGKNRILNSSERLNGAADASRVVQLTSFTEAKNGVTAEVYAPGFTSVTSIQLLSVTYADGSTWKTPQSKVCRVMPDPLMLVAAH